MLFITEPNPYPWYLLSLLYLFFCNGYVSLICELHWSYRFWPGPHPYLANRVQFWGQKWQNLAGSLTTPGPNWAYGPWNEYFGDNLWELWLLLLAATGPERALLALNEHILLNFGWSSIYCHLNISRHCFLLSSERQVISFDQFCSVSFCLSVFVY